MSIRGLDLARWPENSRLLCLVKAASFTLISTQAYWQDSGLPKPSNSDVRLSAGPDALPIYCFWAERRPNNGQFKGPGLEHCYLGYLRFASTLTAKQAILRVCNRTPVDSQTSRFSWDVCDRQCTFYVMQRLHCRLGI